MSVPENATVGVVEGLVGRNHPVEKFRGECEGGDGLHQPRVAQLALLHVEPRRAVCDELGPRTDLLGRK